MTAIEPVQPIAVLGAGAWGTSLAVTLAGSGHDVRLWTREASHADTLQQDGVNSKYLPDVGFPAALSLSSADLSAVTDGAEMILLAVPSSGLADIADQLSALGHDGVPLVLASKGVDDETGQLLSERIGSALPKSPLAILSGPSFAGELAGGKPTAITLGLAPDTDEKRLLGQRLAATLAAPHFRIYLADDPIGVQIGGAVKNVIAIACGVAAGCGFGANTQAALVTRGLAEITRLALSLGGKAETMMGLAGLGDLTLTCSSRQSRNFSYGFARGQGDDHEMAMAKSAGVVEGVSNAATVQKLAAKAGIEMPIVEAINAILSGSSIDEAIRQLLDRPLKGEGGAWRDVSVTPG
ncbi:MAG: NAD(P)-dependent glycerol-3-phosphate dehydrogenase [Alphaproteobacteria bacterium]|nr:NAD(P)-dependent glycerol-3-phosphate dehydrogenase [Alphaproteobacteria bacterium SS10]